MVILVGWGYPRRGVPTLSSLSIGESLPLDPQLCSPAPAEARTHGCLPGGQLPLGAQVGTRSRASGASLPLSQGGSGAGPAALTTLAQTSLPVGPPPLLLLFRLPNYQAEVAVWLALFLYERPQDPVFFPCSILVGVISPLRHLLVTPMS